MLRLLIAGLPPTAIATRCGVTESTVRTQIRAVLAKAGYNGIREVMPKPARLPESD